MNKREMAIIAGLAAITTAGCGQSRAEKQRAIDFTNDRLLGTDKVMRDFRWGAKSTPRYKELPARMQHRDGPDRDR